MACWGTNPTRRRIARSSVDESAPTSRPSKRYVPSLGRWVAFKIRSSVVFPAPDGPINATRSPIATSRSTPRTACTPPLRDRYDLPTSRSDRIT
ncbi:MAG: hypothetical protein NVSMB47_18720 [Polyangiales bacterium]